MWLHVMPLPLDHPVAIMTRHLSIEDVSTVHMPLDQTQMSIWIINVLGENKNKEFKS